MTPVKYRTFQDGLQLRRTKLEIPGWAGPAEPRRDGSHEQAWHCTPFTESAQYGIEIFYPYENDLRVTKRDGHVHLEGDFGGPPDNDLEWPPFRSFGENYYTYQLLLDLKVSDEFAVRAEPHPRVFSDPRDDVPIAVPAMIRTSWWPMISFVVFKAPPEGVTHVFRQGEPFMQFVILPADPRFELVEMDEEEAAERELRGRRIHSSRETLGKDLPGRPRHIRSLTERTDGCSEQPRNSSG